LASDQLQINIRIVPFQVTAKQVVKEAQNMVKLGLFIKAELDGVTGLSPVDTQTDPYFYTFKVVCNSCHEANANWITISRQVHDSHKGSLVTTRKK